MKTLTSGRQALAGDGAGGTARARGSQSRYMPADTLRRCGRRRGEGPLLLDHKLVQAGCKISLCDTKVKILI